jgi:NAD(P)-dependent dehydrogenase (short-subunit alcohol dehydrogenase family)
MRTPEMSRPLGMTGRTILVTGGAGDIGSAVTRQAARLGATVVIADNGTSVNGHGRYSAWEVSQSIEQTGFWTIDDVRLGIRRLVSAYPEYKALLGPHHAF